MVTRKKTWVRKEIVTLPPLYTWAPGSIHTIPLVIIQVGSSINVANVQLGKWIEWAVIDHMPQGITFSTDLKVANIVGMFPSITKITLGHQTMMCHMTWHGLSTGRTDMHQAEEPMVTKIQANITAGVGEGGAWLLDQNPGCRGGNPLSFGNLDSDDIIGIYWAHGRAVLSHCFIFPMTHCVLLSSITFHDDMSRSTYIILLLYYSLCLFYAIQGILSHPSLTLRNSSKSQDLPLIF